jgi:Arc/MetJ-type ribon-helix-helix transcriptional regulator
MAMKPVAVNLPPELIDAVREEAEKDRRSFAFAVREALEAWLEKRRKAKK